MQQYDEQINRIKEKLSAARLKDTQLKVFGADHHTYYLDNPIDPTQLTSFEAAYQVVLPHAYKAFLCQVGNGGKSYMDAAAGPFYGIYPFGKHLDDLTTDPKTYLSRPAKIYPYMSDSRWTALNREIDSEPPLSDELYEAAVGNLFAGILPIGSQGCTYIHGLVLNGAHQGKVVNMDTDRQKPVFTFEDNFLDWYERWLDEIISGDLLNENAGWFGYTIGGTVHSLLEKFHTLTIPEAKTACLKGILSKAHITDAEAAIIESKYLAAAAGYQELWLNILVKFRYDQAVPHLITYSHISLLPVFQFVFWYAKDKARDWLPVIEKQRHQITDEETFRFCTYLLEAMAIDYGYLVVPFTRHAQEAIRQTAFYALGELKRKADYIAIFITGLGDPSNVVVHATLQALQGIKDPRLLYHYKKITNRFPDEQDYILANLEHRLAENGLSVAELRKIEPEGM
ncbi:SMI1/KNR4 family protein [Chitinophaga nivalis]|uniref:SMI1/KNR4 family protein n=1 Tax=Chitinophaga nivalis TaxID=2991709 RepID=A0ABT3IJX7_9BACT|nr:SMI1/KNR4 family protein [Chitinophaga nivalis]MCW3466250.1 SMI1/KNR4 family protein [Chitinophaga nivalis]MCW3484059.1 SMI1/KNR4 family protein [Chitinophaga nivalis]